MGFRKMFATEILQLIINICKQISPREFPVGALFFPASKILTLKFQNFRYRCSFKLFWQPHRRMAATV